MNRLRLAVITAALALLALPRALTAGPDAFTGFGSVGTPPNQWIWAIKAVPPAAVVAEDYSVSLAISTAATDCEISEEGPAVDYFHHRTGFPPPHRPTCDDYIASNLMGPAVTRILICRSPGVPPDAVVTYGQNVGDCH